MSVPVPVPVTASVLAADLAERALATFVQAAVPFLILALQATSWSDARAVGWAALAAGGASLLSLAKGLATQRLTGTASLSRMVGRASTVAAPRPGDGPRPGPRQEGA